MAEDAEESSWSETITEIWEMFFDEVLEVMGNKAWPNQR